MALAQVARPWAPQHSPEWGRGDRLVIHKSMLATLGFIPRNFCHLSLAEGETGIVYLVRKRFFWATLACGVVGKHDFHLNS